MGRVPKCNELKLILSFLPSNLALWIGANLRVPNRYEEDTQLGYWGKSIDALACGLVTRAAPYLTLWIPSQCQHSGGSTES